MSRWIYVSLPHATYGLQVAAGRVVYAPPVAGWARLKPEAEVAAYLRRKGAVIIPLDTLEDGHGQTTVPSGS